MLEKLFVKRCQSVCFFSGESELQVKVPRLLHLVADKSITLSWKQRSYLWHTSGVTSAPRRNAVTGDQIFVRLHLVVWFTWWQPGAQPVDTSQLNTRPHHLSGCWFKEEGEWCDSDQTLLLLELP